MTATSPKSAPPTADDWIERASTIGPRNELFIDGRFVAAASGRTFEDVAGGDGRVITAYVNTFDTADITVPFGGYKQSGFGRDKSLHALDGYSQLKTTWFDLSGG